MAKTESYIDRIFREHGEQDFGKELMDTVTSKQLEGFRCEAFKSLDAITKEFGRQPEGTCEAIFYFMLLEHFQAVGAM